MATVTARPTSVFRSTAFTRFYAGQALSYLGDGLRTLAIPLLVFKLTGSATALGWTWGLELLPYAVVSLIGGSLADRVDRRRLMIICDAVRFVVMAALTLAFATGHLTLIMVYVGVLVLAIAGSIFLGSQTPAIPYLVGKERAKGGVAVLQATEQSVGLVAPPIGGVLFALVGPLPALAANAFTYLASQASIASVKTFGPDEPGGLPSMREIADDIRTGWRWLMNDAALRTLSYAYCVMNFIGSIGFVALIPYFKRAFGAGDHVVGIAFGCFAGGAVVGSLIAGRTHWPVGPALLASFFLDGLGWLPLPFTHSLPLAIAGVTASSICAGYRVTTVVSWRMRIIPEEMIGRVFGVARLWVLAGIFPGSILGGWFADTIGVRPTMLISAYGYALLAVLLTASPAVRRERR
ncbi:MAG TPA: MFS transporter [Candidatus Elarobacter sp.]|jgi:MFS family permease